MKLSWLKNFLIFICFPICILLTLFVLNHQGYFNIKEVEAISVSDSSTEKNTYHELLRAELNQELEALKNQSLWTVRLNKINSSLKEKKWIRKYQITKTWPDKIKLEIEFENTPLVLSQGENFYPITSNGFILESVRSDQSPDSVVLVGSEFFKNKDLLAKAITVVNAFPKEGNFTQKNVAELGYKSKEGFWLTLIDSGLKVKLGEDDIEKKSKRIGQVLEYLEENKFKARVIDANLTKKVLVKLRND